MPRSRISVVFLLIAVTATCSNGMMRPNRKPKPTLYYLPPSPPCRIVLMTGKMLGIEFDLKTVDITKGEQFKPEFLKLNPQHTIPVLVDDELVISESRPIATYLVSKYGKDDSLYPKDVKKRAMVDQRLYFDMGTLYARFLDAYLPVVFMGAPVDQAKVEKLDEAFKMLETYLSQNQWAAGNRMTLADLSLAVTTSNAEAVSFDLTKYPKVQSWLDKCKKSIKGYELNQQGADIWKQIFDSKTKN